MPAARARVHDRLSWRADGGIDTEHFLREATQFCNDRVFGTLSCCLIVGGGGLKRHREMLDVTVDRLRYGCVAVNASPLAAFSATATPWGAWNAAGTPEDMGSGNVQEMTSSFDHAEKGVVQWPLVNWPRPIWDPRHCNVEGMVGAYFNFKLRPSFGTFARLLNEARKG